MIAIKIFFTPIILGSIALALYEMFREQTPKNDAVGVALLCSILWLASGTLYATWFLMPDL